MHTLLDLLKQNNIQKIKELDSSNLVISEDALYYLIKKNNIEVLTILLNKNAGLPFYLRDILIRELVLRSRIDFIDILFSNANINRILDIQEILLKASVFGKITLFKHIVNKYDIDVTYLKNIYFLNACKNKKEKIYLYLWKFQEVKKSLKEFNKDIYNKFIKLECKEKITNF